MLLRGTSTLRGIGSLLLVRSIKDAWRAHTVLGAAEGEESLGAVLRPTTITKGNGVFPLAGSSDVSYEGGCWREGGLELKLAVGDVTNPTGDKQSGRIEWGDPKPLPKLICSASHKGKWTEFIASGGAGALMEDGTLVFPLMAESEAEYVCSMIICSTDSGSAWALSEYISPAECLNPRVTGWEGSLPMIVDCKSGQRVCESRYMGTAWTEAIGALSAVWVNARSGVSQKESLRVDALITATIEERKVMLYTQRGYASGKKRATALCLWVTDNNRTFSVGPVAVDNAANWMLDSTLLHSDGNLHLLQRRGNGEGRVISLCRLTDELSAIKSVLSTWAQKDIFFSSVSTPTAWLVAVFSDAASDGTWNDEYLCLHATVTNAAKDNDGFQLKGLGSRAIWTVNTRGDNLRHVFLSHDFTVVATVTIEETPSGNTPPLTAMLADTESNHTVGLSYSHNKKWETAFEGKTTTRSSTWEPRKEHQVALMLQTTRSLWTLMASRWGRKRCC
ncbi:trans-sialidase [Trypanosoma cruzi]|uniref:Trans-sialidase n=1 Tax=Trypanosoma cruzi TaxID=5693 RepID=A0A7J6XSW0_TRYCR|nr:trans-sialidase [Trypanosoma cruzi]